MSAFPAPHHVIVDCPACGEANELTIDSNVIGWHQVTCSHCGKVLGTVQELEDREAAPAPGVLGGRLSASTPE